MDYLVIDNENKLMITEETSSRDTMANRLSAYEEEIREDSLEEN